HAQTQTLGKTKGRQETHEILRLGQHPSGSVYRGAEGITMNLPWLFSRKVRHADHIRKHVRKIVDGQRDLLSADALRHVDKADQELREALAAKVNSSVLDGKISAFEETANKWLKPYPNAVWRENIEVLLVAIAVAMGIRTFFFQPFKIPTGSMQPTLYGITPPPYAPPSMN